MNNDVFSIAISGRSYTGKTTLSEILSDQLEYMHRDIGSEFKDLTRQSELKIENFGSIPDSILIEMDENLFEEMENTYGIIWNARLACYLARDNSRIFKVNCFADLNTRINRAKGRNKNNFDYAKNIVIKRDQEEDSVYKRLYNLTNIYSENWVNYRIDTSINTPNDLSSIIIEEFIKFKKNYEKTGF